MHLNQFKALTFDCYGTLINSESGMFNALEPLISPGGTQLEPRRRVGRAWTPRFGAAASDAGDAVPRSLGHRLQAARRGVGRGGKLVPRPVAYGRSIADWPAFPTRVAALQPPEAALQARDPVERRQRKFRRQQQAARCGVRCHLHGRGRRVVQAVRAQFRVHAGEAFKRWGSERRIFCTRPRACSMITRRPISSGLASCWIYRRHAQGGFGATMTPAEMPKYDFKFNSMAEMAEARGGG